MLYRVLADLVVVTHVGFVLFVVGGGAAVPRWPRLAWLHLPAVAWGALVECAGWMCPLTPLENALRAAGGQAGYSGDFIARYVVRALYPETLTRGVQVALGTLVLLVNVAVYCGVVRRARRRRVAAPGHGRARA
jgi:hypothetical protein